MKIRSCILCYRLQAYKSFSLGVGYLGIHLALISVITAHEMKAAVCQKHPISVFFPDLTIFNKISFTMNDSQQNEFQFILTSNGHFMNQNDQKFLAGSVAKFDQKATRPIFAALHQLNLLYGVEEHLVISNEKLSIFLLAHFIRRRVRE